MRKLIIEKWAVVLFIVTAVLVLALFSTALSNIGSETAIEDKIQLEKALASAAVSCYAIEGSYPPSVEYLVENYGIHINEKRFTVKYEDHASNLMPDITVLVNEYEN